MNTPLETRKLVELSAKTDRQLIALIVSRLEAGFTFLRLADEAAIRRNCRAAAEQQSIARKAYEEARTLLPCVRIFARAEKQQLECRLQQLQDSIEESSQCMRAAS